MRSNREGFTLVELLIVVVIVGVLAAVAIPRLDAARDKAKFTHLKGDLYALVFQQELFHTENHTYTDDLSLLGSFSTTPGVVITISGATGGGYAATATSTIFVGKQCGVFIGNGNPADASPATMPGVIACTD